jgi:hypothetical protein
VRGGAPILAAAPDGATTVWEPSRIALSGEIQIPIYLLARVTRGNRANLPVSLPSAGLLQRWVAVIPCGNTRRRSMAQDAYNHKIAISSSCAPRNPEIPGQFLTISGEAACRIARQCFQLRTMCTTNFPSTKRNHLRGPFPQRVWSLFSDKGREIGGTYRTHHPAKPSAAKNELRATAEPQVSLALAGAGLSGAASPDCGRTFVESWPKHVDL